MALTIDLMNNNGEDEVASSYSEVEGRFRKQARLSDGQRSPVSISEFLTSGRAAECVSGQNNGPGEKNTTQAKTGRWSLDEKLMFLYGLSLFGKGRWKKIHMYVPERSLVQIKSHAQKVLKRVDAGENVFQRLEDNRERLKVLVDEANKRIEEEEAKSSQTAKKKRKRNSTRKPASPVTVPSATSPWELIHGHSKHRKSEDAPCLSIPSSPSSSSAADPPGVHASQQYDEAVRLRASIPKQKLRCKADSSAAGSGAVIAAVAALCQLSAQTEDP